MKRQYPHKEPKDNKRQMTVEKHITKDYNNEDWSFCVSCGCVVNKTLLVCFCKDVNQMKTLPCGEAYSYFDSKHVPNMYMNQNAPRLGANLVFFSDNQELAKACHYIRIALGKERQIPHELMSLIHGYFGSIFYATNCLTV